MELIKKNPLYFAFLFPAITDSVLTLVGQDPNYWTSRIVNEASPVYYILKASPLIYILGVFLWYLIWYWLFMRLNERIKLFFMFLFIAGHSWGSSSWIWHIMRENVFYTSENQYSVMIAWSVVLGYFALISLIGTFCLKIYFLKNNTSSK